MGGKAYVNMIRAGTLEREGTAECGITFVDMNCTVNGSNDIGFFKSSLMHQQIKTLTCNSGVQV